jgi:hypothetical protein
VCLEKKKDKSWGAVAEVKQQVLQPDLLNVTQQRTKK